VTEEPFKTNRDLRLFWIRSVGNWNYISGLITGKEEVKVLCNSEGQCQYSLCICVMLKKIRRTPCSCKLILTYLTFLSVTGVCYDMCSV
jgi:hypothetical protein